MLETYQMRAARTFKEAKPITEKQNVHLLDWCLGLGGETGEVLDLVKHSIFHGEELDRMSLAKELGDVLWYINALCTTMNMSLEDVAELNIAKLEHRYNLGYSAQDSANRHDKELAFKDSPLYKMLEARINHTCDAPVNVIMIGPDGAGKTTLIKKISEKLGMDVIKCDYRTADKIGAAKELLNAKSNVLYDRFFYPDDIIYSKLKGAEIPVYKDVIELMQNRNVLFIYVYASLDELKKRSAAWADDYVAVDELQQIMANYEDALSVIDALNFPILLVNNSCEVDSAEYLQNIDNIMSYVQYYKKDWGGVDNNG